jgi:hypothetical protein
MSAVRPPAQLDEMAEALREVRSAYLKLFERGIEPDGDCPFASEWRTRAQFRTDSLPDPLQTVMEGVVARAASLPIFLDALIRMFRQVFPSVGASVLARSLVETSLRLSWVLEPRTLVERIQRGLAELRHDLGEEVKFHDEVRDPRPGRMEHVQAQRNRAVENKRTVRNAVQELGWDLPLRQSATNLFRHGLQGHLPELGMLFFYETSAVAHAGESGLKASMVASSSPTGYVADDSNAFPLCVLSLAGVDMAAHSLGSYFGWDVREFAAISKGARRDANLADKRVREWVAWELRRRRKQ